MLAPAWHNGPCPGRLVTWAEHKYQKFPMVNNTFVTERFRSEETSVPEAVFSWSFAVLRPIGSSDASVSPLRESIESTSHTGTEYPACDLHFIQELFGNTGACFRGWKTAAYNGATAI
jgi:hypothetical protein